MMNLLSFNFVQSWERETNHLFIVMGGNLFFFPFIWDMLSNNYKYGTLPNRIDRCEFGSN